jgi:cation transport regulator ChaB
MAGLPNNLFQAFLNWLYSAGEISVPSDFLSRCAKINFMLDNDVSGVINTILDYSVNSATESEFKVECSSDTLQKLLNKWLEMVNIGINGVPTGLNELAKEYYKERWQGSSLCLLRVKNWKNITADGVTISVPTVMWFVNGSSVIIDRPDALNYKLGTDVYYLDKDKKIKLPATNEDIIVQKPFGRWFDEYPTPYLIRKGVYKNWKAIEVLQEKSDEVISKVLPYLFVIEKGTERLFMEGEMEYDNEDFKKFVNEFKKELEIYKSEKGNTPLNAVPFDQKYQHLIPDLLPIMKEELYKQGFRSILSGLGFVDIIQGVGSTRKEAVLNPKPFLSEIDAGISGFKSILLDVINLIITKNKGDHRKFFTDSRTIKVVNSPLKINVNEILDYIRSGFDRGVLSIQSLVESMGFDFETEVERRKKELENGTEDLMYPHLTQNLENSPDRATPAKPRDDKKLPQPAKKGTPEAKNFKAEEEVVVIEEADLVEETMDMAVVKGYAPVTTDKYVRLRQHNPDDFEKDSFRIIVLSEPRGIKAVIGRKKGEKTTSIQSYLFDRTKWTVKQAQEWVKKHRATVEEVVVANLPENIEAAPYDLRNAPKSIKKLSKDLQDLWVRVFNENYSKYKDEARAHRTAWFVVNREKNKTNKSEKADLEIKNKKKELLDKQIKLVDKLSEGK